MTQESAITVYGARHKSAPDELSLFSFLAGKWAGVGRTRLEDGSYAEFEVTWIGRYILDGMAIAHEMHAPAPDGSPYPGISFRYFDPVGESWVVEYLNVSGSFIRRQVNAELGSVDRDGSTVIVTSVSEDTISREFYRVVGEKSFVYSIDLSNGGGATWNTGSDSVDCHAWLSSRRKRAGKFVPSGDLADSRKAPGAQILSGDECGRIPAPGADRSAPLAR